MPELSLQEMIDEVLVPLLDKSHAGLELLDAQEGVVVLRVSGAAAHGAGAEILREQIIRPAILSTQNPPQEVRFELQWKQPLA